MAGVVGRLRPTSHEPKAFPLFTTRGALMPSGSSGKTQKRGSLSALLEPNEAV